MIRHLLQTAAHRLWVAAYLFQFAWKMVWRAQVHDLSKYGPTEARRFARLQPQLRDTTYGTDEYEELLERLRPALNHHYAKNSHHPEHYPDRGVGGMDLADLVEMYCDWRAAVRRHDDGDLRESIRHNYERFDLDRQLLYILANTAVKDGA